MDSSPINSIKFIGFGARKSKNVYEFVGIGVMDGQFPCKFIGFGARNLKSAKASGLHGV